jgi:hypothetical protein
MTDQDFRVALPPHARMTGMIFNDINKTLRVSLDGCESEQEVPADHIIALCGARIIQEKGPASGLTGSPSLTILTASTWPRSLRPHTTVNTPGELEFHLVLALRIRDVEELWSLVAGSFDFHTALGANTGLVTEANFRTLLLRLSSFAPAAACDAFVAAMLADQALPEPLHSLVELFRIGESWRS